jgi:hypothetical protein
MKSTNMAFDDAFAHIITEIGGDWDKWKSDLGSLQGIPNSIMASSGAMLCGS